MSLRIRSLTLALSLLYFSSTWASSGDQAYEYRTCVSRCNSELCLFTSTWQPSLALRLTGWTCIDDCKYSCMHLITAEKIKHGNEIHQYHGKWPFWRWAGMQEPASVAFSLFNLFFHVKGARRIQRVLPVDHPMRWYYVASAIVSINAWIWSAVFHTRGWYLPSMFLSE